MNLHAFILVLCRVQAVLLVTVYCRLDSHAPNADLQSYMQQQQMFAPQQIIPAPQQEELQTVTHKKVVVRTIQTRDGQVRLVDPTLNSISLVAPLMNSYYII